MAEIVPFRGLRYTESAGASAALIAPPYDVISPDERERLHAQSPQNVVRVESDPAGSEVWFSGKKQGDTPFELRYDAATASRSPLTLELRHAGYRAAPLSLTGRDEDGVLVGTLTRRPSDTKKPDKPPASGTDDIRLER